MRANSKKGLNLFSVLTPFIDDMCQFNLDLQCVDYKPKQKGDFSIISAQNCATQYVAEPTTLPPDSILTPCTRTLLKRLIFLHVIRQACSYGRDPLIIVSKNIMIMM